MGKKAGVKDTSQGRLAADAAEEQEGRYNKIFGPIEKMLISEVQAQPERYRVMSQTAGAYGSGAGRQVGLEEQAPLSSAVGARLGQVNAEQAGASGLGLAQTQTGLESDRLRGIQGLTEHGRGQAHEAMSGMQMAADQAAHGAIENARLKAQRTVGRIQALGTIGGAAAGAYMNRGQNGWGGGPGEFQHGLHVSDWSQSSAGSDPSRAGSAWRGGTMGGTSLADRLGSLFGGLGGGSSGLQTWGYNDVDLGNPTDLGGSR